MQLMYLLALCIFSANFAVWRADCLEDTCESDLGEGGSGENSKTRVCENDFVVTSARVVVIADIHGDGRRLLRALQRAHVVGDDGKTWIGGDAVFVQTGDVIDRGPDSVDVFTLIMNLRKQAREHGGCVLQTLGNHELMNLVGDFRYAEHAETERFGGMPSRRALLGPKSEMGQYLRSLPLAIRVVQEISPDVNFTTIMSHAGIEPWLAEQITISTMNTLIHKSFRGASEQELLKLAGSSKLLRNDGPLWTRLYAIPDETRVCRYVERSLNALGSDRMIVGHSVQMTGRPTIRCKGKLVLADTGMSEFYGGGLSLVQLDPEPGCPIELFE
mmetsp:Transcript_14635/g.23825  ORF Transcript_14635/g.23825 Transcript_14635/m.23825 type:complete len:330 (+) Transcript_14635:287-1276(+)|eukprot:CAMPEP_0203775028 /NCGR_PEP_ID=MMETSP0099_2-20121227/5779_1 /ASSEMBLY_ACC=CAM_ASM_000209 /TAXON_ID=96639 /ORGANISM=" , Strain NY0313808BC1" /LENGTH=329 /DNA_ID=CAMNT_0050673511 /DNA_START=261 /DNA_END=1250 /DNA_ORIENTATION=+